MALTNFVLTIIILSFVSFGHGFGLFGTLSRLLQLEIAIALGLGLLILSRFWLSYFRYGPLEWLWRNVTYRTRLDFVMLNRILA